MSDRLLIMDQGRLVEQGPVEQVLAHPQHDYTQRLMADVPLVFRKQSAQQWPTVEALPAAVA